MEQSSTRLLTEKVSELYISKVQGESLKACALKSISHTDFCTEAFSYSALITLIILCHIAQGMVSAASICSKASGKKKFNIFEKER